MEKHPAPAMGTNGDVIGQRLLAFVLDSIILSMIAIVVFVPFALLGDAGFFLGTMVIFAISIVYAFLLEGLYGYTPGKQLMGLVVVKSDGSNCTVGASVVRNLLLIIDQLPFAYLIGLALLFVTEDTQRVGDLVADTVVVKQR
ncbi:RDD family protein [Natrialbaceae archaeon A-CW3]